jgi:hypothetical protein
MEFKLFQTTTATMKRNEQDGFGDESAVQTFTVNIDPVLGKKRIFNNENEEITGMTTIVSPHDSIDVTFDNYTLDYNGRQYRVEQIVPFYKIGTNKLSHFEIVLR